MARDESMAQALGRTARRLVRDSKAGTAIEYGLIAALIVVALIAAMSQLADVTTGMWGNVNAAVTNAH